MTDGRLAQEHLSEATPGRVSEGLRLPGYDSGAAAARTRAPSPEIASFDGMDADAMHEVPGILRTLPHAAAEARP